MSDLNSPQKSPVDTLIRASQLLTMAPGAVAPGAMADAGVAISQGRLKAVGSFAEISEQYVADQLVELPHHVLMPGLVNTHGHAAMTLLRGLGAGRSLQSWLEDVIWPLERKHVGPDFVRHGVDLALAEMLRNGITCFSDMYFLPELCADRARLAGMRAQIAFPVIEIPNVWSENAEAGLSQGLALHDSMRHDPLINIAFGPHSVYTVSEETLSRVQMYADELDARVEIHLHENAQEISDALNNGAERPLARLLKLGLVSDRLQAVHMTQVLPEEIETLASFDVKVTHCPASNMLLASGQCPVTDLQRANITVGLGTDGAASNNSLHLLMEARLASQAAKQTDGPTALKAQRALSMATYEGARVLGLEQEIGSLEVGKWADCIAVDLRAPSLQPMHDLVSQLIHSAGSYPVNDVWIAGRRVLSDGELLTLDQGEILQQAGQWQQRLNA